MKEEARALARLAAESTGTHSAFASRLAWVAGPEGGGVDVGALFLALCQTKAPGGVEGAQGLHRAFLDPRDIRPWVKLLHACHASGRARGATRRARHIFRDLVASGALATASRAPSLPTRDAARTCCNLFLACLKADDNGDPDGEGEGDGPPTAMAEAEELVYRTMPELGLVPDATTFNTLLGVVAGSEERAAAAAAEEAVVAAMAAAGVAPDGYTFGALIRARGRRDPDGAVFGVLEAMEAARVAPGVHHISALFVAARGTRDCRKLQGSGPPGGRVLARVRRIETAMLDHGVCPNAHIYSAWIRALAATPDGFAPSLALYEHVRSAENRDVRQAMEAVQGANMAGRAPAPAQGDGEATSVIPLWDPGAERGARAAAIAGGSEAAEASKAASTPSRGPRPPRGGAGGRSLRRAADGAAGRIAGGPVPTNSALDLGTYAALLDCCARHAEWKWAFRLYIRAKEDGVRHTQATVVSLLRACAAAGVADRAMDVYESMRPSGFRPCNRALTATLQALGRAGRGADAVALFDAEAPPQGRGERGGSVGDGGEGGLRAPSTLVPDVRTFTACLSAACSADDDATWRRGAGMLAEMRARGVVPDAAALFAAIDALVPLPEVLTDAEADLEPSWAREVHSTPWAPPPGSAPLAQPTLLSALADGPLGVERALVASGWGPKHAACLALVHTELRPGGMLAAQSATDGPSGRLVWLAEGTPPGACAAVACCVLVLGGADPDAPWRGLHVARGAASVQWAAARHAADAWPGNPLRRTAHPDRDRIDDRAPQLACALDQLHAWAARLASRKEPLY